MGLFDFFKRKEGKPKAINHNDVLKLTEEELQKCREEAMKEITPEYFKGLDAQARARSQEYIKKQKSSPNKISDSKELWNYIISKEEATKLTDTTSVIDIHFLYLELSDIAYKKKDESQDWLNKAIELCEKDIAIAKDFLIAHKKKYPKDTSLPRIPAFERLAIIYEKQGKYEEVLNVCDKAMELGLRDSTKGGFEGRINKIQKKLNN